MDCRECKAPTRYRETMFWTRRDTRYGRPRYDHVRVHECTDNPEHQRIQYVGIVDPVSAPQ